SISPFSMDQTMMARSNTQLISASLLQIYHDVLEHNLSCWVTEATCPYSADVTTPEWGPYWSNRVYRRTVKLDQMAQSTRMIQLARSQDRAATRALHLSIMAFATQWAQGSRRQRQQYLSVGEEGEVMEGGEINEEFDRNLQRHFWDLAQRALQEVSDLESYRVVCAELVFGLTQKPWNEELAEETMTTAAAGTATTAEDAMTQVNNIISSEGPPMYMERAARKMHALKYRYDSIRRRGGQAATVALDTEDTDTIGLLYWLTVMFDTVSSSMNERPVVVSDDDCHMDESSGPWKIDMFADVDNGGNNSSTTTTNNGTNGIKNDDFLHWPCSYEAAAEAVVKSAPVKILLFRHVSYLQNLLRKGIGGRGGQQQQQQMREVINSAMSVYRYWNSTYGAFFRELVHNFELVPPRIQGWFFCISAHWHLAALMLADLLLEAGSLVEEDWADVACTIRTCSVRELSDLARVATGGGGGGGGGSHPRLNNLHHAVSEGTILTEPWTMILIRAFSKAVVLGRAGEAMYSTTTNSDVGYCIRALWLLGKKSDMARKAAEVL
ncbi:hypothetical protein BGZ63DRAFT_318566, partial [Mariannaea sp. PMI_226]